MTTEEIPEGWKECKLGDVATIKTGKTNSVDAVVDGAYPLFDRSMNVKKSSKYLFDCEAVLVPGEGKEFAPRYYKGKFDLHQRTYAVIPNQQICDGRYCYYTLLNGRNYFSLVAVGSTVMSLRLSTFELFDILLPPLAEQRAIASVLSSLDDKIDLLHRQNQTLEKMAEAIFRQWFIEEADEGWKEGDIYNLIEVDYGYPFKSKLFNEEGIGLPLVRIRDLKRGTTDFYTNEEYDVKYEVNTGDIVAGMDGEFKVYLWGGEKALLNQRACRFRPKYNFVPHLFVYSLMKPYLYYYENVKVGTTVIHLGKSDLDEIRIRIPPREKLVEYGLWANPAFAMLKNNYNQIRTLEKLRDTLLPKLMSGEVRVKI